MSFVDDIRRKATGLRRQVVLPEGTDPRTVAAAVVLQRLELPAPVLLGPVDQIRRAVDQAGGDGAALSVIEPAGDPRLNDF
ncbi:MAG TPA: phosphate acyltransferase, partial [Longimicrobiales bacterium]